MDLIRGFFSDLSFLCNRKNILEKAVCDGKKE